MQTKETTLVELSSSLEEVNNILVTHIQRQFNFKIENVVVDRDGVITFTGTKTKDVAQHMSNSATGDNLASSVLGGPRRGGKGTGHVLKNLGMNDFIRKTFLSTTERKKIDIKELMATMRQNGFEVKYPSSITVAIKKSNLRKIIEEVDTNVFRRREGVDPEVQGN